MTSSAAPLQNLSGLASGIDTNTIVTQLMQIESQPLVRLQQKETVEQARQQALKDVKTRLANLQNAATALGDPALWSDTQSLSSTNAAIVAATRTSGTAAGGYDITVSKLAAADQIRQGDLSTFTTAGAADTLHLAVGAGTAVDVSITSGDTLDTIASKINGSSGSPVYATVVNSKLVLSGKTTGAANTIAVTSTGTTAADIFGAGTYSAPPTHTAADASYTVNGKGFTSATNTVTDGIPGLSLTLAGTTASAVSIVVGAPGADNGKIKDAVQSFVDQYNSTLDFVQGKLDEQKVTQPKNDQQRTQGVLHGDLSLSMILSQLRQALSDPVTDSNNVKQLASSIGISTGAATSTIDPNAVMGKLTLDSTKLIAALSANVGSVKGILTNATGDFATKGLKDRFEGLLKPLTNNLTGQMDLRVTSSESQINLLKQHESDWKERLKVKETALRAQFTAMETALAQSQSQGQWLSGQIAKM
ncbi:MAG TPA: flagellar filament capping protein FliD [Gaiellaceae bacterium]|jgi:flagellar hook-associated protein 2|nr:flagellar filament capping protein FliD [Gaiellaceae bacterium]